MRGYKLLDAARRAEIVKRHDLKFTLYETVKRYVKTVMAGGEATADFPGASKLARKLLTEFYGVTTWPGHRQAMPPIKGSTKTMYYPRPKSYRPGSPIVLDTRYYVKGVLKKHTSGELITHLLGCGHTNINAGKLHKIDGVSRFFILTLNPEMVEGGSHDR